MDAETKRHALDKAEAMDEFVAYPSELLDEAKVDDYYARLHLDETGDYFRSVLRLAKFGWDRNFEKLHVPVNKSDWVTHGRVAVVNAFYNLVENSIQFPAGKSQTPIPGFEVYNNPSVKLDAGKLVRETTLTSCVKSNTR